MVYKELSERHRRILCNKFSTWCSHKRILDIGCGFGNGANLEILESLGLKADGIDSLTLNFNRSRINNYIVDDVYSFNGYHNYDIAMMCDVTYIFECDPIDKVLNLFDKIISSCERFIIFVPFFNKNSKDFMFRSSKQSPVKKIIRPMYADNVLSYFPGFKKIVIHKGSADFSGYGVYQNK